MELEDLLPFDYPAVINYKNLLLRRITMGETIQLTAADDVKISAYLAIPVGESKGGVVVVQEIFGVNKHIREVCDGYASDGYMALAPAIFDRIEPGVELGYEGADMERGIGLARGKLKIPEAMLDVQAAIDHLHSSGPVAMVGYCFGGLVCWLSSAQLKGLSCVSGYYGGGIAGVVEQNPKVPTMLHFGDKDAHIPLTDVDAIKAAHPEVTVHVYDADHGFNCDHRSSYDEAASMLAKERTLTFFVENLG
ncbi:MAG: carboxymethylenebutenolidase [Candidatus Azotimanducaceae bacterium]|jgi:carboxymethylenebutenolidase